MRWNLKFNVLRVEGSIAMKENLLDMMTKQAIIGDEEDSSNDSLKENDRLPFDF